MSMAGRLPQSDDPSIQAMISEHERLAALYLYNAEMGEKRVAAYLTIVSIAVAGLVSLPQYFREHVDEGAILQSSTGVLLGLVFLGLLTFFRLVERRARGIEYLRAINRIHSYFVYKDAELEPYFSWPPADDYPSFGGRTTDFAGLRDVIAALNSLSLGGVAALLLIMAVPGIHYIFAVSLGLGVAVVAWLAQHYVEQRSLRKIEELAKGYIRFPRKQAQP